MADDTGFDERYAAWRAWCQSPDVALSSSDDAYVDNDAFRAIVALGPAAIPAILDKLESDPEAHFLIHALAQITGKEFGSEELTAARERYGEPLGNQGYALLWRDWLAGER